MVKFIFDNDAENIVKLFSYIPVTTPLITSELTELKIWPPNCEPSIIKQVPVVHTDVAVVVPSKR